MSTSVKICTMCGVEPRTGYNSFCRGCNAEYMRRRRGPSKRPPLTEKHRIAQYLLASSRSNAGVKGQEHTICREDIVVPDVFPVYGTELKRNTGCREDNSYSIDRIDPTKGYIPGNVVVISWRANRRKADLTTEEIRAFFAIINS